MLTVSKYIASFLEKKKISNVPIFQGGAIMNIINEIGKSKKIKFYCPYHEQALAMQIDAMARLGIISSGFVTSGPGATNLLTGILCSYYDSVPGVYFTGQVGQYHIQKKDTVRQRGFQETDVISIFKNATKYCVQVKKAEDIKYELEKSFHLSQNGRPGPCILDVPYNIQISSIDPKKLKSYVPPKIKSNPRKFEIVLKKIKSKKKILVIAGGGVRHSNQIQQFHLFIKNYKLPFVTTWASQDITDHKNKFFFGSLGRHAYKSANKISEECDLIISLGCRFSPKILNKNFAKKAEIISIDIDKNELNYSLKKINFKINEDLKSFFSFINNSRKKITQKKNKFWIKKCNEIKIKYFYNNSLKFTFGNKYVDPYKFFKFFSKLISSESIIFTDAGCNLCWCMQSFEIKLGQRLISAWGNSPMGYSVAASIGPEILKKKNVYSLIGDGSFLINLQELHFINKNNLKSKIIVFDNRIFGNTQIGSMESFGNSGFGNNEEHGYYAPDIKKIANCFNFKYLSVKNNTNIKEQLIKFIKSKKRTILHLNISPEQKIIDYSI